MLGKGIIAGAVVAVIAVVALAAVFGVFSSEQTDKSNPSDESGDEQTKVLLADLLPSLESFPSAWTIDYGNPLGPPGLTEPGRSASSGGYQDYRAPVDGLFTGQVRIAVYIFDTVEDAQTAYTTKKMGYSSTTDVSMFDQCFRTGVALHTYVFQYENVYGWVSETVGVADRSMFNAILADIEDRLETKLS